MSAVAPQVYPPRQPLTKPDALPSMQRRAENDLRFLVDQHKAQIEALELQYPRLKANDDNSTINSYKDSIACHKEIIAQLEAGIAWGVERAKAEAAKPGARK